MPTDSTDGDDESSEQPEEDDVEAGDKKDKGNPTRIDTIFLNPVATGLFRGFRVENTEGIKQHRQLYLQLALGSDDDSMFVLKRPQPYPIEGALPMTAEGEERLADIVVQSMVEAFDDNLNRRPTPDTIAAYEKAVAAAEDYLFRRT